MKHHAVGLLKSVPHPPQLATIVLYSSGVPPVITEKSSLTRVNTSPGISFGVISLKSWSKESDFISSRLSVVATGALSCTVSLRLFSLQPYSIKVVRANNIIDNLFIAVFL